MKWSWAPLTHCTKVPLLPPAKIFEGFSPWVPQTKPIFVEGFGLLWLSRCYCVYSRLSLALDIVHIVNALKYLYLAFLSFWMNDVHTTCSSSTCLSISQLWFNRSALWMGCWELYRYFASLASITLLQNTMELNCYDMLLVRLSSELQLCFEVDKMECTKMYVCWFDSASVSHLSV